jgi:EAL domain-containing protein (putative c-di-GMP-specific phosphodiesterase class I)
LAVDDAGAGYASFAHVLQLRPDVIKLDRCLTAGVDDDPAARAFISGVVLVALELGADVTAEGVETEAELTVLETLGVDNAQGHLLARPSTDQADWRAWQHAPWLELINASHYRALHRHETPDPVLVVPHARV